MFCWGNTALLDVPEGEFVPGSLVAHVGGQSMCGLRPDGTVECWGRRLDQVQLPPDGLSLRSFVLGYSHGCGYDADTDDLVCWGTEYGLWDRDHRFEGNRSTMPPDEEFSHVAAGPDTTCGLRASDGAVMCWGSIIVGEGRADSTSRFQGVGVGIYAACGVTVDGTVECWREPYFDSPPQVTAPAAVEAPDGVAFADIDFGEVYGCGLVEDTGHAACWGRELAAGTLSPPEDSVYTQVVVAHSQACGLLANTNEAECWGGGSPAEPGPFTDLAAGIDLICGLRDTGEVVCWGDDVEVPEGVLFSDVTAGQDAACGIRRDDGLVECWGREGYWSFAPDDVVFEEIAISTSHGCGLLPDSHEARCWGRAGDLYVDAPEGIAFQDIDVGWMVSCGIRADDGVEMCWGLIERNMR